jgi:hypothetical protein
MTAVKSFIKLAPDRNSETRTCKSNFDDDQNIFSTFNGDEQVTSKDTLLDCSDDEITQVGSVTISRRNDDTQPGKKELTIQERLRRICPCPAGFVNWAQCYKTFYGSNL